MSKLISKIIFILILTISLNSSFVFAADNPCPSGLFYKLTSYENNEQSRANTPLFNAAIFNQPCFELGQANYQIGFQFFFDLAVGASVALAVILFTAGAAQGIFYAASSTDMKAGKDQMQKAVVGLLVVLSIWLVVNTVNPDLLRLPALQNIGNLPTRDSGTPGGGPGGVAGKSAGT